MVELPTWLGDTVMASEAVGHICDYADEVILVGSPVATKALENYPKISKIIVDNKKNRPFSTFQIAKKIGKVDLAISFRSHIFSKLLTRLVGRKAFCYHKDFPGHQVQMYHGFVEEIFGHSLPLRRPKLYFEPIKYERPTLGVNPGATYGSAKRWYPEYFADVIIAMKDRYDVIIFGGPGERDIAEEIERLVPFTVQNLAGRTSVEELIRHIGGLNLFITNDSGPMHIAAAYDTPQIALFGPTDRSKTSPYSDKAKIVSLDLECAPCMKRVCPLKHHRCMKDLTPQMVIEAIEETV